MIDTITCIITCRLLLQPCPGNWCDWASYDSCTGICANGIAILGTQRRRRVCACLPPESPGGPTCPGEFEQIRDCVPPVRLYLV